MNAEIYEEMPKMARENVERQRTAGHEEVEIGNKIQCISYETIKQYKHPYIKTNNPRVVKLSWLENAYSRPVLLTGDLDQKSRSG